MAVRGMLGKKVGMTQIFDTDGKVIPVTVVATEPNVISQVRTVEKDGYSAAQLAYQEIKVTRLTRPAQGHFAAAGIAPMKYLCEFDIQEGSTATVGETITPTDVFTVGERIQIAGVSKGKGFAGVVKRYHFRGQEASHGSSLNGRKPMSSGATDAARTFKGTRKPGRMGNERVTQQGLKLIQIDADRNIVLIKGAIPGANGGLVYLEKMHRVIREPQQAVQVKSSKKK